jgi:hypothetical protein
LEGLETLARPVIYFSRILPGLLNELIKCNIQVYEALAISEVTYLIEQHLDATIVIDASVEESAAQELARRFPTLRLAPDATAANVIWELESNAPTKSVN